MPFLHRLACFRYVYSNFPIRINGNLGHSDDVVFLIFLYQVSGVLLNYNPLKPVMFSAGSIGLTQNESTSMDRSWQILRQWRVRKTGKELMMSPAPVQVEVK